MTEEDKLSIWRSSRSGSENSFADTPSSDHLEFFTWLQLQFRITCQHCKGWNQSCVHNDEKACLPDLLSSFVDTNYLLVLCSGFYNLKITPSKRKYSITELNDFVAWEYCYWIYIMASCYKKTGSTLFSWNATLHSILRQKNLFDNYFTSN